MLCKYITFLTFNKRGIVCELLSVVRGVIYDYRVYQIYISQMFQILFYKVHYHQIICIQC